MSDISPARATSPGWVRLTWAGWGLGVLLVVAFALLGEATGFGGAQVFVGAGMGTGVGLLQARALRSVLGGSRPWVLSSSAGLAAPFLAADLARAARWTTPYSLHAAVALGGLLAGLGQARILRARNGDARGWALWSFLAWSLAGGAALLADSLSRSVPFRGLPGALAYLGIVASGGLVLGLVSLPGLTRALRRPR